MAIIDASNQMASFHYGANSSANFESYVNHGATFYSWTTSAGHVLTAYGTGITVDGSNMPTGGAITRITIDINNDNPLLPDIDITDLSVGLTDVVHDNVGTAGNRFWTAVLDGETEVVFSGAHEFTIGGDFVDSSTDFSVNGLLIGADDLFFGAGLGSVYGDTDEFDGRDAEVVLGGDDSIFGGFSYAIGDVENAAYTTRVIGGDDSIVYSVDPLVGSATYFVVVGDVEVIQQQATILGGDDMIDMRAVTAVNGRLYGDVGIVYDNALIVGGNDLVYGTGADDQIFGDAEDIYDDVVLQGGDDTLYGGAGADAIYGDYGASYSTVAVEGGNDLLFGGMGSDSLYGNEGDDTLYGGADADFLVGGAGVDSLFGGSGADTISGQTGNDTLNGGAGADNLIGGEGRDTASYMGAGAGVVADLRDSNVNTGEAAGDFYYELEDLQGSEYGDNLRGTGGNNMLFGEGGNDILNGRFGNDTLNGGAGADTLIGGNSTDTASYLGADRSVVADLRDSYINTNDAAGDVYMSVENLLGTGYADNLRGDWLDNHIDGAGGYDLLRGRSGNDTLDGGNGNDTMFGGSGTDEFVFDAGTDLVADCRRQH